MKFFKFWKWQQWFYPNAIFDFYSKESTDQETIYLTFDDGPTPGITNVILDVLERYNAKATFFCVGENVKNHSLLYQEIIDRGHAIGNHSMSHLNGFKTSTKEYVRNVLEASQYIKSDLFRPPFGKCTPKQHKQLSQLGFKTIFWSHLSYDFDDKYDSDKRLENIKSNSKNGTIVVFHDSIDLIELEKLMEYYLEQNYKFSSV